MHDAMMALAAFILLCLVLAMASTDDKVRSGWCAMGLLAGVPLSIMTFFAFA